MRSVIKKCQDKVALIKEELQKKQAQLMQVRPNDIYSSTSTDRNQTENVNTFYSKSTDDFK